MPNQQRTSQSLAEANNYPAIWASHFPDDIGDLFAHNTGSGLERIRSYRLPALSRADIERLDPVTNVSSMGVIMGSDGERFVPLLRFLNTDQEVVVEFTFQLDLTPVSEKPFLNLLEVDEGGSTIITAGVAKLLGQKWAELSEAELSQAFFGITADSVTVQDGEITYQGSLENRRVTSYYANQVDAQDVAGYMLERLSRASGADPVDVKLHLLLGAGLTIQMLHPFNFRPMIYTEAITTPEAGALVVNSPAYYERFRPCPPYCPERNSTP